MKTLSKAALVGLLALDLAACGLEPEAQSPTSEDVGSTAPMSFDDFMSKVYQEPWEGGLSLRRGTEAGACGADHGACASVPAPS